MGKKGDFRAGAVNGLQGCSLPSGGVEPDLLEEQKRRETAAALEALFALRYAALSRAGNIRGILNRLTGSQRTLVNRQIAGKTGAGSRGEPCTVEEIAAGLGCTPPGLILLEPAELRRSSRRRMSSKRLEELRNNLLRFGLIRARAGELAAATGKSLEVFDYQYRRSLRRLFPLGIVSRLWRRVRTLCRMSYFSRGNLGCIRDLGISCGCILKMVYAPLV
ncbi:MAG: hypothetical protein LBD31_08775 [Treponema sp.]|jgi:hypothetical protein|nr:hypothetical protein [Treponema sp.]